MEQEKFSTSQGISMMILYLFGVKLILLGDPIGKQDSWIAGIIAIIMALAISFIYTKLLKLYPDKDIFQILDIIYGKILSKFIIFLYLLFFIFLGALDIRNMSEYIQVVSLPETPQYFSAIFFCIFALYGVKSGVEVLFRWAKFVLPIVLFTILSSVLLSIPDINFTYIRPILYNGWKPVLMASIQLFVFPFGDLVVFLPILNGLQNKTEVKKVFSYGIIWGGIILLTLTLRNTLTLGYPNISYTYFPSYFSTSLVKIGNYIQRLEILVSVNLLLAGLAKYSVVLLASSVALGKLFNDKNYRKYTIYLTIVTGILALIMFNSTMEMFMFLPKYPYVALPFQVVIPIITLVIGSIRKQLTANS